MVGNAVSQRRPTLVGTTQSILCHSPGNITGKSDRVKFIHPLNNALDQAAEWAFNQWLGDTDHIHMAFIPHIKGMLVRLGGSDHLLELWPLIRLPAGNTIFRVDVLVGHDHIVAFGIV